MMSFDSWEDAHQKLHNCVVLFKARPVHMNQFEAFRYKITDLLDSSVNTINVNDALKKGDLDIRAFDLGYANYRDHNSLKHGSVTLTRFIGRRAVRKFKAGLAKENATIARRTQVGKNSFRLDLSPIPDEVLISQSTGECIVGKYPSYWEAIKMLQEAPEESSIAISRRSAINKEPDGNIMLTHMLNPVLYVDGEKLVVPKKFKPLAMLIRHDLQDQNVTFKEE